MNEVTMRNQETQTSSAVNVGEAGGDLQARRFALAVTATLTILALPPLGVSESNLRLASMLVAMCGTLFLMAGLVFLQKTHYAGMMLIPAAGLILLISQVGSRTGAVVIGTAFCAVMAANLLTGRCAFNRMLGINSCSARAARAAARQTAESLGLTPGVTQDDLGGVEARAQRSARGDDRGERPIVSGEVDVLVGR